MLSHGAGFCSEPERSYTTAMPCRLFLITTLICAVAGCNKPKPHQVEAKPNDKNTAAEKKPASVASEPARPVPDACTLLTSDEVKSVLGEAVQETKPSNQSGGSMAVSQCYFALPTAANSAVLTVMQRGGRNTTRDWWEETFHREHDEDKGEREEGEKKVKPEKVDGLGDDAFWTATKIGGALYVLKGDTSIRISVGGKDDLATKLKKSRALAEIALKRL